MTDRAAAWAVNWCSKSRLHFPALSFGRLVPILRLAAAMRKAGADIATTGENAVVVGAKWADVIIGPVGIVIADALYGEITPNMAVAVGQSSAKRILIPVNHCDNLIAGVSEQPMGRLIESVIALISEGN